MKLRAAEADVDDTQDDQTDKGQGGDQDEDADADAGDADDDAADEGDDADDDGIGGTDNTSTARRSAIEERAESERLARERGQLEGERAAQTRADNERLRREEQRREEELLATMDENQRTTYLLAKEVKNTKDGQAQTQLLLHSSADQNKFTRTLSKKPQFAKYEDEVERRHQDTLARGGFVSRDVILAHLIGEKALAAEANNKQKQRGERRIQSQRQGTSGSQRTRGDRTGTSSGGKTLAQRAEEENWAI